MIKLQLVYKVLSIAWYLWKNWERSVKEARSLKEIEDALKNTNRREAADNVSNFFD